MPLIEIKKNLTREDMLVFVAVFPIFLGLLGITLYYREHVQAALVLWQLAPLIGFVGMLGVYVSPKAVRWVYLGWIYAVFPIGWVISHLAMAVIYFLVITPTGLFMRLLGHDPMQRKLDRSAGSYWHRREPAGKPEGYFRQF